MASVIPKSYMLASGIGYLHFMEDRMALSNRPLPLVALVVGLAWASGCGRTPMDLLVGGSNNSGGAIGGWTGSESGGGAGGGGTGGIGQSGTGGVPTGGSDGGVSGICGEARCLTLLFQTCVPEGDCRSQGGGSPSAVFSNTCYSNGVTVSYYGSYKYGASNLVGSLTVNRKSALCYKIEEFSDDTTLYVVSDGNGQQVATGIPGSEAGSIIVTCDGGKPTAVDQACLFSAEYQGECTLEICP